MNINQPGLKTEVNRALAAGMHMLTPDELDRKLEQLGYERDRNSPLACVAKNLLTGNSFPKVNFNVVEKDTRLPAFHIGARRDDKFTALQKLRQSEFCLVGDCWWSV